jgi:hypothetical protein
MKFCVINLSHLQLNLSSSVCSSSAAIAAENNKLVPVRPTRDSEITDNSLICVVNSDVWTICIYSTKVNREAHFMGKRSISEGNIFADVQEICILNGTIICITVFFRTTPPKCIQFRRWVYKVHFTISAQRLLKLSFQSEIPHNVSKKSTSNMVRIFKASS